MNSLTFKVLCFLFVVAGASVVNAQAKLDCEACVDFMNEALSELARIIVGGGIIGSCEELCDNLQDGPETYACDLLCSLVGIKAFEKLVNETDPDPIYICDELNLCSHAEGGVIIVNSTVAKPPTGPEGTTFHIDLSYTVVNTTSTGQIIMSIYPPSELPLGGFVLVEGQQPGYYTSGWDIPTKDQNQPFPPGNYSVVFDICAGDCTTDHKYGGLYAQVNSSFLITKKSAIDSVFN